MYTPRYRCYLIYLLPFLYSNIHDQSSPCNPTRTEKMTAERTHTLHGLYRVSSWARCNTEERVPASAWTRSEIPDWGELSYSRLTSEWSRARHMEVCRKRRSCRSMGFVLRTYVFIYLVTGMQVFGEFAIGYAWGGRACGLRVACIYMCRMFCSMYVGVWRHQGSGIACHTYTLQGQFEYAARCQWGLSGCCTTFDTEILFHVSMEIGSTRRSGQQWLRRG